MWDENPYYNPEKMGLELVDCIDFSSGCYEFDYTVVWKDLQSGQLYYADDSGCSCPAPFEDVESIADLTPATPSEIQTHLEARDSYESTRAGEIADLMAKLV